MKFSSLAKKFVLATALLLSITAFASNKGSLQLSSQLMVNGKQLPAGAYSVQWEGSGSAVQVSILKGRQVIMTAPARVIDLNSSPETDATVIKKNDDGSRSLAEIRFGGKKKALSFDGASTEGSMAQ